MLDNSSSFLIVLGTGALLLRPHDIPLFARGAGRVCGTCIRSLRNLKNATESALQNTESTVSDDHALSLLRENLRGAYNHFDSLANTLRRDLAGVPLHPAAVLRHGWHNLGLAAKERDREMLLSKRVGGNTDQSSVGVVRKQGELHDSKSNSSVVPQSTAHNGVGKGITGVDFIARSIEEAALAEQKKRMLGHPSNSKHGIG